MLTPEGILAFQDLVYYYYKKHGRTLPWRKTTDPYYILVSEIMLQQTQVERVVEKYGQFIRKFPNFARLAEAPLYQVLEVWRGLGYNRRAVALKKIAQIVMDTFDGTMPADCKILMTLPGVGRTTAAAISAFAFNKPVVFIETNVRTVFIHVFFRYKDDVKDADIYPLVEETLDRSNPREWYYALMDYGVILKKSYKNPSRKSAHHKKQPLFEGSNRQLRGIILNTLIDNPKISESELVIKLNTDPQNVRKNLVQLEKEGFFKRRGNKFIINSV
jgi:A/G-specific adenine glycosylase